MLACGTRNRFLHVKISCFFPGFCTKARNSVISIANVGVDVSYKVIIAVLHRSGYLKKGAKIDLNNPYQEVDAVKVISFESD